MDTEADTPLGERENFAGFPLTPRTGWWEGPRPGTSEGRAALAWRTRGPARAQGAQGEALPPVTLIRALIRQPAPGPASPAKNRLVGHPAARAGGPRPQRRWPGSSGHSRTWGRTWRPRGNRRAGTLEPDPAGGSSKRAGGGAAWADAAHCDLRAEAYRASAAPAPRSAPARPGVPGPAPHPAQPGTRPGRRGGDSSTSGSARSQAPPQ